MQYDNLTVEELIEELVGICASELDEEQLNEFVKITSALVRRTEGE